MPQSHSKLDEKSCGRYDICGSKRAHSHVFGKTNGKASDRRVRAEPDSKRAPLHEQVDLCKLAVDFILDNEGSQWTSAEASRICGWKSVTVSQKDIDDTVGKSGHRVSRRNPVLPLPRWPEIRDEVTRIDAREYNSQRFFDEFETCCRTVVLRNGASEWPAADRWTLKQLCELYGDRRVRVGSNDKGKSLRMQLGQFLYYVGLQSEMVLKYARATYTNRQSSSGHQGSLDQIAVRSSAADGERQWYQYDSCKDGAPIYMFDEDFDDDKVMKKLCQDYDLPKQMPWDLLKHTGSSRPPHKWFLIGPCRSGSTVHIDPLGTAAWNALISGYKWWIVFPLSCPKEIWNGKGHHCKQLPKWDGEAVTWFLRRREAILRDAQEHGTPAIEFVQRPGEVVFVPPGCAHGVLNITDTVAVTQNFVSPANLPTSWRSCRKGRSHLARKWKRRLRRAAPDLHAIIERIDRMDGVYTGEGGKSDPSRVLCDTEVSSASLKDSSITGNRSSSA